MSRFKHIFSYLSRFVPIFLIIFDAVQRMFVSILAEVYYLADKYLMAEMKEMIIKRVSSRKMEYVSRKNKLVERMMKINLKLSLMLSPK